MRKPNDYEPYVVIMGNSMPRSELFKLIFIAAVVIVSLSVAGILYYLDWAELQEARADNVEQYLALEKEVEEKKKEALTPLEAFFEDYLSMTRIDEVTTIRAAGIYELDGNELDFTLLARNPRLYKYVLRIKETATVEFGYDGENAWFQQTHKVIDVEDEELKRLNQSLAILESAVPCLAWDYDPATAHQLFELMPDSEWNRIECYVIKNNALLPGTAVYHYIDKKTGFEHYRRASIQINERSYRNAELFYDIPLDDSEYPLPSGMELQLDGRVYFKARFDTIEINKGLAKFLFEQKL